VCRIAHKVIAGGGGLLKVLGRFNLAQQTVLLPREYKKIIVLSCFCTCHVPVPSFIIARVRLSSPP